MEASTLQRASMLSDDALLTRLTLLARSEREATAELVAHLAEVVRRQLHLGQGHGSLFAYCLGALRLSEHAAYNRIEAARAARKFPVILGLLEEGAVNLTVVRLLAPHLTAENHLRLLGAANGKRKREVEEIVACLAPRADVPTSIRALPAAKAVDTSISPLASAATAAPVIEDEPSMQALATTRTPTPHLAPGAAPRRAVIAPLAPERYLLQVTLSRGTREKLRLLQDLLCRDVPSGDPATIIDKAFDVLILHAQKKTQAATAAPRVPRVESGGSRYVPPAVERVVRQRDGNRCAFVAPGERRCEERRFLELHHVTPFAAGGRTTVDNLSLRCRAHNVYEARQYFGQFRLPELAPSGGPEASGAQEPPALHKQLVLERVGTRRGGRSESSA